MIRGQNHAMSNCEIEITAFQLNKMLELVASRGTITIEDTNVNAVAVKASHKPAVTVLIGQDGKTLEL